jgi:hypothetical protein
MADVSGGLSGAASGASAGATFGPWGAAIGGALGGLFGLFGGRSGKAPRRQFAAPFSATSVPIGMMAGDIKFREAFFKKHPNLKESDVFRDWFSPGTDPDIHFNPMTGTIGRINNRGEIYQTNPFTTTRPADDPQRMYLEEWYAAATGPTDAEKAALELAQQPATKEDVISTQQRAPAKKKKTGGTTVLTGPSGAVPGSANVGQPTLGG